MTIATINSGYHKSKAHSKTKLITYDQSQYAQITEWTNQNTIVKRATGALSGKRRVTSSHVWFWFYSWLVEKPAYLLWLVKYVVRVLQNAGNEKPRHMQPVTSVKKKRPLPVRAWTMYSVLETNPKTKYKRNRLSPDNRIITLTSLRVTVTYNMGAHNNCSCFKANKNFYCNQSTIHNYQLGTNNNYDRTLVSW